jgi:hypothetical protein
VGIGEEGLFLLVRGDRYASATAWRKAAPLFKEVPWTTFAENEAYPFEIHREPIPLKAVALGEIETMTFVPFKSRAEVLEQVRRYCVRPAPPHKVEALENPLFRVPRKASDWDPVIFVPLEESAETLAHQWWKSGNATLRWNALRILRHFNSPENAGLLETLTHEPVTTTEQEIMRTVAFSTLQEWGKPVEWRRNHTLATPHTVGSFDFWVSVWALFAAPLFYWRWSRRRGHGRLWRAMVSMWWAAVSLLIAVRSIGPMDGFEAGWWRGGAIRGNAYLFLEMRQDTPHRSPFLLEHPLNMPDLMAISQTRWPWDWEDPMRAFQGGWGHTSVLQDTFFEWDACFMFRLPLWIAGVVLIMPTILLFSWRAIRRRRQSRYRPGFPVIVEPGDG